MKPCLNDDKWINPGSRAGRGGADVLRLIVAESFIDGNYDQVGVGVTEIDRADRPDRTCTWHRHFNDRHAERVQRHDYFGQRGIDDEAQVGGTGHRLARFRLEYFSPLVQVDLLRAKDQRLISVTAWPIYTGDYIVSSNTARTFFARTRGENGFSRKAIFSCTRPLRMIASSV